MKMYKIMLSLVVITIVVFIIIKTMHEFPDTKQIIDEFEGIQRVQVVPNLSSKLVPVYELIGKHFSESVLYYDFLDYKWLPSHKWLIKSDNRYYVPENIIKIGKNTEYEFLNFKNIDNIINVKISG